MTDKSNKKVDMSRWHEWHVNSYWCRGTCTPAKSSPPTHTVRLRPLPSPPTRPRCRQRYSHTLRLRPASRMVHRPHGGGPSLALTCIGFRRPGRASWKDRHRWRQRSQVRSVPARRASAAGVGVRGTDGTPAWRRSRRGGRATGPPAQAGRPIWVVGSARTPEDGPALGPRRGGPSRRLAFPPRARSSLRREICFLFHLRNPDTPHRSRHPQGERAPCPTS